MEPKRTSPLKHLLDRIRAMVASEVPARPILLVGDIGSGKTSTGLRLISLLRQADLPPGGILAPRILKGDETVGYSIIDLATNTTHPFASLEPNDVRVGRYFVSNDDVALARRAIERAAGERPVVLVDEVGRLELTGGGHAPALRELLASSSLPILLVRNESVEDVVRVFGIGDHEIFNVAEVHDTSLAGPSDATALWEIVDGIPFPLLSTLGDGGFPEPRPMSLVARDDQTLWFATSRASRKVAQIEANPNVTVLFVDTDTFNYASLYGKASIIVDPAREQLLWQDDWRDDWPEGPSDPDYVLLRVDVTRARYLRGSTGESGTVDLALTDSA
jgi:general stress protein 26/nucleoside-triphosphatase THEP1